MHPCEGIWPTLDASYFSGVAKPFTKPLYHTPSQHLSATTSAISITIICISPSTSIYLAVFLTFSAISLILSSIPLKCFIPANTKAGTSNPPNVLQTIQPRHRPPRSRPLLHPHALHIMPRIPHTPRIPRNRPRRKPPHDRLRPQRLHLAVLRPRRRREQTRACSQARGDQAQRAYVPRGCATAPP